MSLVFFQKPLLKGPLLQAISTLSYHGVDMHFHTEYSMDGISKIKDVLENCTKEGVGVAITDHNEIAGAVDAFKKKKNQFIIPGIELVCHQGNHLLLYFNEIRELQKFFKKEILPLKRKNPFFLPVDIEQMLWLARSYPCITCVPHPFGPGVIGIRKTVKIYREILEHIDLIEGINGACFKHENKKALNWAKHTKKGITAGSDGHTTAQLGEVLCFSYGKTIPEFLQSLKNGKSICVGTRENLFGDFIHTFEKFWAEERHEKGKLMELYESRYATEFSYLKDKVNREGEKFFHHFHIHHSSLKRRHKKFMKESKYYRHILRG